MDRKSRDEDDESSGRHAYKRTHVRSLFARADLERGPLPQGRWVHTLAPLTPERLVAFPERVEAEDASLVPVLHDVRRVVDQWCRTRFGGRLTLNLDWDVTLRGNDFYGKRFRAVLETVRERSERAKKRKLSAVLMENGRWNDGARSSCPNDTRGTGTRARARVAARSRPNPSRRKTTACGSAPIVGTSDRWGASFPTTRPWSGTPGRPT